MAAFSEPPRDLYGRDRPDRFMRNLTAFLDAYRTMTERAVARSRGTVRQPPPVRPAVTTSPAWRPMIVASRTPQCTDVVTLRLLAAAGGVLPRWQPGAHLRVRMPSGLIRHYSLCGDLADRRSYTIAVRRLPGGGGGSVEVHDSLGDGSTLQVLGPRNGFPFAADPVVLFIAGGIGITPLLPMVRQAAARHLDWRLVYCGRSADTMPFADDVTAIDPARVSLRTDDVHGTPDGAALIGQAPAGAAVYCCGPPPMLDAVRASADSAGVRAFHFERFTAAPVVDGRPFVVELRRSGTVFTVPADRSLLDVLRCADSGIAYSCRQGFCGTCVQRVLSGSSSVEHRDRHLTDDERARGDMLVCVSRAPEGERLVLDL